MPFYQFFDAERFQTIDHEAVKNTSINRLKIHGNFEAGKEKHMAA
jgi:hypothetical protein